MPSGKHKFKISKRAKENRVKEIRNHIIINDCRHYYVINNNDIDPTFEKNRVDCNNLIFYTTLTDIKHPFGKVYKFSSPIDNNIGFVTMPDYTVMMFDIRDWNNRNNPFSEQYSPNKIHRVKKQLAAAIKDIKKDIENFVYLQR